MLLKLKLLNLFPLRYVIYSPTDYYYNNLGRISIFVEFSGKIYRKDNIDKTDVIDKKCLYKAIKEENLTRIHEFETLDSYIDRVKKSYGSSGRILGEIQTLK